jgi:hypothetical protein
MFRKLLKLQMMAGLLLFGCFQATGILAQNAGAQTSSASALSTANESKQGTSADSFLEKAKHPIKGLTFQADLRVREEYFENALTLNNDLPNHESNYQRYRFRFGFVFSPVKDLDIGARIITERRSYLKPDASRGFRPDEFLFDNLYISWRNVFSLPVKLTVGRQDMNLGSSWLIGDGTSGDGSRTYFFTAARATIDLKKAKTTLDLAAIIQPAYGNTYMPVFHDLNLGLNEQNENGFIAYLSNKSVAKTQIDAYFIYKHNSKVMKNGDQGDIYVSGAKLERDFTPHWKLKLEMAPEWGTKNGRKFRAFGSNNRMTYSLNDKLSQKFRLGYEYLSGDDPSSQSTNEAFDILWGRWPQWSDLYVFSMIKEKRVSDWTNLHRLDFGWTIKPAKKLEMIVDYMPLFAPQNS